MNSNTIDGFNENSENCEIYKIIYFLLAYSSIENKKRRKPISFINHEYKNKIQKT